MRVADKVGDFFSIIETILNDEVRRALPLTVFYVGPPPVHSPKHACLYTGEPRCSFPRQAW